MKGIVFEVPDAVYTGRVISNSSNTLPIELRQKCAHCGGKLHSHGGDYQCKYCLKWTVKVRQVKGRPHGPPCVECGGITRSFGWQWKCTVCGRRFYKINHRRIHDNKGSGIKNAKAGDSVPGCIQPTCPTDANRRCPLWFG